MLSKRKLQLLTFLVIFSQIFGEEMPTDDGSFIECNYFFTGSYECIMSILNENGRDDFEGIGGENLCIPVRPFLTQIVSNFRKSLAWFFGFTR